MGENLKNVLEEGKEAVALLERIPSSRVGDIRKLHDAEGPYCLNDRGELVSETGYAGNN